MDPVRQFFEKLDGTKAKCTDCGMLISNKIERLRGHRNRCAANKRSIETDAVPSSSQDEGPPPSKKNCSEQVTERTDQAQVTKQICQPKIRNFPVVTNGKTALKLKQKMARFFYACNIPFNVAENESFLDFISELRPGWKPATRKELAGALLDQTYEQLNEAMFNKLENRDVTLVQDGWSDIHNNPVIATCVHDGSNSYFVHAENTGTSKKTSAFCAELALKVKTEVEEKYQCHVKAIVTDNEKKMEVMRKSLKEADPTLVTYGCSSHLLNLLGQEITHPGIINQIVEVAKYFRNHHTPAALLAEKYGQGKQLNIRYIFCFTNIYRALSLFNCFCFRCSEAPITWSDPMEQSDGLYFDLSQKSPVYVNSGSRK